MIQNTLFERVQAEKMFKADVKKHIDAISSKYIIPGVTSDQAILFLPAEAIFAEINAYHTDILEYNRKKYKKNLAIAQLSCTFSNLKYGVKNYFLTTSFNGVETLASTFSPLAAFTATSTPCWPITSGC